MTVTTSDIEKIVDLTITKLNDDYDYLSIDELPEDAITELVNWIDSELNTITRPALRVKVLAKGITVAIVASSNGTRIEIPLQFCYPHVNEGAEAWAEYRHNPNWGRWYLVTTPTVPS